MFLDSLRNFTELSADFAGIWEESVDYDESFFFFFPSFWKNEPGGTPVDAPRLGPPVKSFLETVKKNPWEQGAPGAQAIHVKQQWSKSSHGFRLLLPCLVREEDVWWKEAEGWR